MDFIGLGNIIVHTRLIAEVDFGFKQTRSHGNDGCSLLGCFYPFKPSNALGRLISIKFGHLHIHQDDVIVSFLIGFYYLPPVIGHIDIHVRDIIAQIITHQHDIKLIVLRN